MNMRLIGLCLSLVIASNLLLAQRNHVENWSFEYLEKKVKTAGDIEKATGWKSLEGNNADLFAIKAKDEGYRVPDNMYGKADSKTGDAYAGFIAWSSKDAVPRTYLVNELKYKLEEDKVYCVKMHLLLGVLSKYATNNIGIYVSDKLPTLEEIQNGEIEPQVIHSQNQIWEEQFDWVEICGTVTAKGREKFLTIGNFGETSETESQKMKRPRGFTGQQTRSTAYYYVDDVSVYNMASGVDCDCEKAPDGSSMQVKYSTEVSTDVELDYKDEIEITKVYFPELSSEISERAMVDVQKVAEMLKKDPEMKVQIKGHTDPVEQAKASGDVSLLRAQAVKEKLVELGAKESKLQVQGMKDFDPATDDQSVSGQAQNRRVVFDILD